MNNKVINLITISFLFTLLSLNSIIIKINAFDEDDLSLEVNDINMLDEYSLANVFIVDLKKDYNKLNELEFICSSIDKSLVELNLTFTGLDSKLVQVIYLFISILNQNSIDYQSILLKSIDFK